MLRPQDRTTRETNRLDGSGVSSSTQKGPSGRRAGGGDSSPDLPDAYTFEIDMTRGVVPAGTLMVREKVAACTPALAATSRIVARRSRRTTFDPACLAAHPDEGRMTGSVTQRLDRRTVLHADADLLPDYDRSAAPVITHIGLGALAGPTSPCTWTHCSAWAIRR